MTGIDRLRTIAGAWGEWGLGGTLDDIAEQIERELREDAAWVREHGGLDHVKSEWRSRVPYDLYERRRQRLLGHIAECEDALGRRNERISEMEKRIKGLETESAELRKRAMPEGMEWPTVDGKPVDFVTGYEPSLGVLEAVSIYSNGACEVMGHDGIIKDVKEIHVAIPKVLDADGAEIRVGETVWHVKTGREYVVVEPSYGKTVVVRLAKYDDAEGEQYAPDQLTHERPENKCRDCAHWQKDPTADNMGVCWFFYHEHEGQDCYAARRADIGACEEFMPRGKALAGDA